MHLRPATADLPRPGPRAVPARVRALRHPHAHAAHPPAGRRGLGGRRARGHAGQGERMRRLTSWIVTAALVLSRPAAFAGLVLVVLLSFRLIPPVWWWAAIGGL